jgi:hypothetical protein
LWFWTVGYYENGQVGTARWPVIAPSPIVLGVAPTPVLAEIQVSGGPEAVTIEAPDASVEEVLAALSRTFDMNYYSSSCQ